MEIVKREYLQAATKEGQELHEAAAALMDFAGLELTDQIEMRAPVDLTRLGVECRRQGTELVVRWDGDKYVQGLMEMNAELMAKIRARAAAASSSLAQMTETIRVTKYVGFTGLEVKHVPMEEFREMLVKVSMQVHPPPLPPVPAWIPGVPGLHLLGCSHRPVMLG